MDTYLNLIGYLPNFLFLNQKGTCLIPVFSGNWTHWTHWHIVKWSKIIKHRPKRFKMSQNYVKWQRSKIILFYLYSILAWKKCMLIICHQRLSFLSDLNHFVVNWEFIFWSSGAVPILGARTGEGKWGLVRLPNAKKSSKMIKKWPKMKGIVVQCWFNILPERKKCARNWYISQQIGPKKIAGLRKIHHFQPFCKQIYLAIY